MGLLVIAIMISALWIFSVVTAKILWPGQKSTIWPSIIPVLLVWGALLFGSIGLRATSSLLAAVLSMLYAGAGGLMLFTPGPYRFLGLLPILSWPRFVGLGLGIGKNIRKRAGRNNRSCLATFGPLGNQTP